MGEIVLSGSLHAGRTAMTNGLVEVGGIHKTPNKANIVRELVNLHMIGARLTPGVPP